MKSIEIIASASSLPKKKIKNTYFNQKFQLNEEWITKRTGIQNRYFVDETESNVTLSIQAAKKAIIQANIEKEKIGMIIVATTSSTELMPGISYQVQAALDIKKCFCLDILAGCSGYINAFDIAQKYIALHDITYAMIIGCDTLSQFLEMDDIQTSILLGDAAGATIISASNQEKQYASYLESIGQESQILTCTANTKIQMDGKKIFKFAVKSAAENINRLLKKAHLAISDIDYIIPHQANIRILDRICQELSFEKQKMLHNLDRVGNTFCASIPVLLEEALENQILKKGDKIILVGFGGGLNVGSVLLEI